MKRPSAASRAVCAVLALTAASALTGCASGSSAPAPAQAAGAAKKRLVLVEARGPGPELERFVPRLLSAASDRGLGAIVDARLSGAHLVDVAAAGEISAAFRREYPGDVYIGALMSPCSIQRHEGRVYDRQQTPGGVPVRTDSVVVTYDAECTVVLTLVGEAGTAVKTIDVTGRNGSAEISASNTEAEGQAAADAADRAAKKLASSVR